jgi:hypothetical protein
MWLGNVVFGTNREEMSLLFDTGSDWLTVKGSTCTTCTGKKYNISESLVSREIGLERSERYYGSAMMEGTEYTDTVCVG